MNCVYGKKIYTGGRVVEEGYLAFNGRKISGLSKSPRGKVLGRYSVLTPAFIDAHSHIGHLIESGVDFGLMTDHPVTPARQIFLQTRWFIRAGLSKQHAVELVSRKNAEILGIHHVLGCLQKGKWASFICWNHDPFDLASYPLAVYGEGDLLFSE